MSRTSDRKKIVIVDTLGNEVRGEERSDAGIY